jgi:hypothetical protein
VIGQSKWSIVQGLLLKKNSCKHLCFGMHDNQIQLINKNLNKYPSSCKVLHQKGWWIKLGIISLLKQMTQWSKMHPRYSFSSIAPQFVPSLCSKVCSCTIYRWLKESTIIVPYWYKMLLFGEYYKYHDSFVKGQSKWPIAQKTIQLWYVPTFGCTHN